MGDIVVSVIIATYRRFELLESAVRSLLNQTYSDFEVIIVDDNADEEWNQKVQKIVSQFNHELKITLIVNESNKGSAKSRNIGIDSSKAEYITFLDDDDMYLPNKIKTQVENMQCNNSDYSLTNLLLCNEDDSISEFRNRKYLETTEGMNLRLCHLKYHMTGTDTMMFKRDYLIKIGGFDYIDAGDEFYLMMKAIENNGKFSYCDNCEVKALVHSNSVGLSIGEGKISGENALYEYKKTFFNGLKQKDIRYIRMRHYAVCAFAYKRNRQFLKFFGCGVLSFIIAPVQCANMLSDLKREK